MAAVGFAAALGFDERGSGRPIILLHGSPFDRRMWAPQLAGLSGEFRIVAPDLPGYGSSPLRAATMTMRAFADAVVELLDALGIDRAVVVGLSMGGLVAMELALGRPERVEGVVLAATSSAPLHPREAERRRAAAAEIEANGMLATTLEMAGSLFGPRARRNPPLLVDVLRMMLSTPPAGAAAALRGRAEHPDYSSLLPELAVPSLVIAGDADGFAPEEVTAQLVDSLPEPELLVLPGVGHLPNLEEPGRFNAALRAFVAGIGA
jgi:3-oxoadipate enol-lactonase